MSSNLLPTIQMMNEMCEVVVEMERNGMHVDVDRLDELEHMYTKAVRTLREELLITAQDVMGDTPINLDSPEQLSRLLYSRCVKDKKVWAGAFGLGSEQRGSVKKKKQPRYYKPITFNKMINALTEPIKKTRAEQCKRCKGSGRVYRKKQDGTWGKAKYVCTLCEGGGIHYIQLDEVAGFKLLPRSTRDVTVGGFTTEGLQLELMAHETESEDAKQFLEKLGRFNAFSSNLSSAIGGIRRALQPSGRVHTNLMQCVTATGRLSSTAPNLHNQTRATRCPRCRERGCSSCLGTGYVFPIRSVFISRFPGGSITEGDFSQLEFRMAAELSGDEVALAEIIEGIDQHAFTAEVLTDAGQPTSRQDAKPHTFKPLYGGTSGTKAEKEYYKTFLEKYKGIEKWHSRLLSDAQTIGIISLPSGREYAFSNVVKYRNGYVSGSTQIKNYPVQGFATADIVPIAAITVHRLFQKSKPKSLLINEVHDSIVVDTYPGEEQLVSELLSEGMLAVPDELKRRYDYVCTVPFDVEIKNGRNWLEME